MNKKYFLAGSLICADFLKLERDIKELVKGNIDYIHFDVMDGQFVPRFGLFPEVLTQVRTISELPIDIHMMVEDAEKYIETFVKYGATKKDIFTVHSESTRHLNRVIGKIKTSGMKAGVALNPGTSLETLRYVLDEVDMVMLMAINPGIVGHKLIPAMIDKIGDLKAMIENRHILIGVDGGVTFESAPKMVEKGATFLVCGSQTIFRSQEAKISQKAKELRKVLDKLQTA